MGSKKYDPEKIEVGSIPEIDTKYYHPQLHTACFVLPKYVNELISR
jgi:spermidine synthase